MPAYEPDEGMPPLRQVIYEAVEGVRPDVKIRSNMDFGFDFSIPGSRYMIRLITEGEQDTRVVELKSGDSTRPGRVLRSEQFDACDPSATSNLILRWLLDRDPDMQFGEPAPQPNDGPSMHDLVIEDMKARKQFGLDKYGSLLQAFNGRKPLKDLYEELLDAVVYTKQALAEDETRRAGKKSLLNYVYGQSIRDQLDHMARVREASTGKPEDGPYPAAVSEIADEVMSWMDGIEEHAPGIHEAVANRLGARH